MTTNVLYSALAVSNISNQPTYVGTLAPTVVSATATSTLVTSVGITVFASTTSTVYVTYAFYGYTAPNVTSLIIGKTYTYGLAYSS